MGEHQGLPHCILFLNEPATGAWMAESQSRSLEYPRRRAEAPPLYSRHCTGPTRETATVRTDGWSSQQILDQLPITQVVGKIPWAHIGPDPNVGNWDTGLTTATRRNTHTHTHTHTRMHRNTNDPSHEAEQHKICCVCNFASELIKPSCKSTKSSPVVAAFEKVQHQHIWSAGNLKHTGRTGLICINFQMRSLQGRPRSPHWRDKWGSCVRHELEHSACGENKTQTDKKEKGRWPLFLVVPSMARAKRCQQFWFWCFLSHKHNLWFFTLKSSFIQITEQAISKQTDMGFSFCWKAYRAVSPGFKCTSAQFDCKNSLFTILRRWKIPGVLGLFSPLWHHLMTSSLIPGFTPVLGLFSRKGSLPDSRCHQELYERCIWGYKLFFLRLIPVALCYCIAPLGQHWAAFASPELLPEQLGRWNSSLHTNPMGWHDSMTGQHDAGCCVAASVFPASRTSWTVCEVRAEHQQSGPNFLRMDPESPLP